MENNKMQTDSTKRGEVQENKADWRIEFDSWKCVPEMMMSNIAVTNHTALKSFITQTILSERKAEREKCEKEKLASNIALMTLLVRDGKKGDMERLIDEFTKRLALLESKNI